MKLPKILYFIDGPLPTKKDIEAAGDIKANVVFRNAQHVPPEQHALEECDGVAGEVPHLYAKRFKKAGAAIEDSQAEHDKLTGSIGDDKPPKADKVSSGAPAWQGAGNK